MTAREELARAITGHEWQRTYTSGVMECSCGDSFKTSIDIGFEHHLADALLASPALAGVIREREFEAIKAANLRAIKHEIETPPRGHGGCCGGQTEEPT